MKRAKQPPSPELVGECSVLADMISVGALDLELEADDPDPEKHEYLARVVEIRLLAIAEYLRRFPKTRKQNNHAWRDTLLIDQSLVCSENRYGYTGDRDIQCFFCRRSINTIAAGRSFTKQLLAGVHLHTLECGVRMMAGLVKPHKPLPDGVPGR